MTAGPPDDRATVIAAADSALASARAFAAGEPVPDYGDLPFLLRQAVLRAASETRNVSGATVVEIHLDTLVEAVLGVLDGTVPGAGAEGT